jgi:hypothetical protein
VSAKKASELQVGDEFYRTYREPDPKKDWSYVIEQMRNIPQHDFYGRLSLMIEVHGRNRILGPAVLRLNPEETVWVVD